MLASSALLLVIFSSPLAARDVVFPPTAPLQANLGDNTRQYHSYFSSNEDASQEFGKYAGLTTFANLPWVHCLSSDANVEKYDVAFLGAPFDTATTGRPGARFGPTGIRL